MMKGKGASGFLKQVVSLVMSVVKAKSMAVKSKTSAFKTRLIVFGLLRNKKVLMTAVSHKIHALLGGHDDHHQHDDDQQLHRSGSGAAADDDGDDDSKAVVLYSAVPNEEAAAAAAAGDDDDPEAAASAETSTLINSLARWRHLSIVPYHGDFGMIESTGMANLVNNINGDDVEAAAAEEEEEEEEDDDDDGYPDLRHSLFDEEEEWYLRGDDGTGSVVDLVMRNMIRGEEEDGGREFVLEDEIDHVADVFIRRFHRQMRMQKLDSFKRFQEMMERSF